jgi:hypothetical protein
MTTAFEMGAYPDAAGLKGNRLAVLLRSSCQGTTKWTDVHYLDVRGQKQAATCSIVLAVGDGWHGLAGAPS